MAWDRPFDDAADDAPAEPHPQRRGPGADATAGRAGRAEVRTPAEYYEVLRAADDGSGQPGGDHDPADVGVDGGTDGRAGGGADRGPGAEAERSGWDAVDAGDRPPPDRIRVSPERAAHILDGDPTGNGGGHRHGTGRPGKTEFPASWDDQKVLDAVLDVARRPDGPPVNQDRNNRWLCTGMRDRVEASVIVLPDGEVWTAWPEEGSPGVVRNPRKGRS
jgi:Bacterial EndoU nuclease